MSTREKGRKAEQEYEELLQTRGFVTQRVKGSTMFNKNVDFFGKWDIIGFEPGNGWVLAQVKSEGCATNKIIEELDDWIRKNQPPNCKCYLAIRNKLKKKKKTKKKAKGKKKEKWREIPLFPYNTCCPD